MAEMPQGGQNSSQDPTNVLEQELWIRWQGWSSEIFQVLNATPPENVEQRDLYDRWFWPVLGRK